MTGRVVQIFYGQGHGFVRDRDRRQLFFHRRDVAVAHFNTFTVGDGVAFEVIEDELAGPRAVNVKRVVGKRRSRSTTRMTGSNRATRASRVWRLRTTGLLGEGRR